MSSDAGERRLHPLSFLFILLAQLPNMLGPLVLAFFAGQKSGGDQGDEYALIGVAGLMLYSIAQYFTYRYRIERDAVVVRSGVFERSLRHIPFARIQDVSLHQNLLHRLFRVAEVRLESAGAAKPEAKMRVLRLRDAHELEAQIRGGARGAAAVTAVGADGVEAPVAPASTVLLELPTAEVLRLGLVSNRGIIALGAGLAVLAQTGNSLGRLFTWIGQWIYGHAGAWHLSWLAVAGAVLVLAVLALLSIRLITIGMVLWQFHGFRLSEQATRLTVERGLVTRVRSSLPRRRIQAWTLEEGIVHRWLRRRSLRVESAVQESGGNKSPIKDLAPIATPAAVDALVRALLGGEAGAAWPPAQWQALHAKAALRRSLPAAVLLPIVTLAGTIFVTRWALLALALWPLSWWLARQWARHSGWSVEGGLIVFRGGWLSKHWRFAEVRKLQALEWRQSPFDRRWGMASLHFDTAGAGGFEPELAIPYLPAETARRLYDQLAEKLGPGA